MAIAKAIKNMPVTFLSADLWSSAETALLSIDVNLGNPDSVPYNFFLTLCNTFDRGVPEGIDYLQSNF